MRRGSSGCTAPRRGFNPHPTFLPGDAILTERRYANYRRVSIHTRHFCRVMLDKFGIGETDDYVSIHTRHFCRVMPEFDGSNHSDLAFQSTPDISAG